MPLLSCDPNVTVKASCHFSCDQKRLKCERKQVASFVAAIVDGSGFIPAININLPLKVVVRSTANQKNVILYIHESQEVDDMSSLASTPTITIARK